MASYAWTIQDLQTLSASSLQLTYNTDAADTLNLSLRPERYAELPLVALDRLTVTDGERIVFSGLVPMGANCAAEAAAGETVEIELQSDYYILGHTVYAKTSEFGKILYASSTSRERTTTLQEVCSSISRWLGGYLPSHLQCSTNAVCVSPHNNGTAPCSSLLTDAMRWAPDAVLVHRYGASGNRILVTTPSILEGGAQTETVVERPSGTTEENWNGFGFGCIVQQSGTVKRLEIECRHNGSAQPANVPVWVKIWLAVSNNSQLLAVSNNSQLLAVSNNSQLHSVNAVLSYEFPEFEVTAGDELRVSFHTADGLETTAYQMGVQCCMRVVAKNENEPGGMLGNMGSYGDTSQRRWMAKYAWHIEVKTPLPPLALSPATHPLQSVSLRSREDLRVPVCALVGGVHETWPQGADIRTLGAFVYAVPRDKKDEERGGAGSSPASSKMIVKGVHLPDKVEFEDSRKEFQYDVVTEMSNTSRFIKAFMPEYAPFIAYNLKYGACVVKPVSRADYEAELQETDEDAKTPANYSDDLQSWSADGKAVYVHTEGSFPASSNSRKNVKGLRWCKASLAFNLAIQLTNGNIASSFKSKAEELFPGRIDVEDGGKKIRYLHVRQTFTVNLINRRSKKFDPATNKLLSTDADFNAEGEDEPDESPTMQDYKKAMAQYYAAASKLQHEGSISMLYDGSLNPAELTGRWLTVHGMRPEWEEMQCVVRSVNWNYEQRKLSLSVGPRSVMGFSEYLERRVIARNRGRNHAQEEALPYDPEDEEAQKEEEESLSVSPSISSSVDKSSTGRWVKPFTLYTNPETEKLTLKGGTFRRKKQSFKIEDSDKQFQNGQPTGGDWTAGKPIKLKMKKIKGMSSWTFDIFQN